MRATSEVLRDLCDIPFKAPAARHDLSVVNGIHVAAGSDVVLRTSSACDRSGLLARSSMGPSLTPPSTWGGAHELYLPAICVYIYIHIHMHVCVYVRINGLF